MYLQKTIFAGMISPSVAIFLLTYLDLYHFRITKDKYFMNLKITYPSCTHLHSDVNQDSPALSEMSFGWNE